MLLSDSYYIFMEQMPFLPARFPEEVAARAHLIFTEFYFTDVFNGVTAISKRLPSQRGQQASHHSSTMFTRIQQFPQCTLTYTPL